MHRAFFGKERKKYIFFMNECAFCFFAVCLSSKLYVFQHGIDKNERKNNKIPV